MDKLGVDSHHISPSNISHRHTNTQPPTESIHTKTKKLIKYLNQTWCVGKGWCKLSMFVASLASSHRQKEPVRGTDPSDWKGERWFVSSRQPTDELLTCTGWIPPTFHIVSWKRRMMINLLYGCETLFITSNSVFQKCVSSRNTSLNENSIPFFCWSWLIRINEVFVSVGSYVFSSVLQGWWNWVTLYGGHQWFLVSPLVAYRLCLRSLWFMSPLWQTDGLTCCLIAYWCNHTGRSYLPPSADHCVDIIYSLA